MIHCLEPRVILMYASIIGKVYESAVADLKQSQCTPCVWGNSSRKHMARGQITEQRQISAWTLSGEKNGCYHLLSCSVLKQPSCQPTVSWHYSAKPLVTERTTEAGTYRQRQRILRKLHRIISISWRNLTSCTHTCLCTPHYWLKDCLSQNPHKNP